MEIDEVEKLVTDEISYMIHAGHTEIKQVGDHIEAHAGQEITKDCYVCHVLSHLRRNIRDELETLKTKVTK